MQFYLHHQTRSFSVVQAQCEVADKQAVSRHFFFNNQCLTSAVLHLHKLYTKLALPAVLLHRCKTFWTNQIDLIAVEGLATNELNESVSESATIGGVPATDCDDCGCTPQPVTSTVASIAVGPLRTYFKSSELCQNFNQQLDGMNVLNMGTGILY